MFALFGGRVRLEEAELQLLLLLLVPLPVDLASFPLLLLLVLVVVVLALVLLTDAAPPASQLAALDAPRSIDVASSCETPVLPFWLLYHALEPRLDR
jgi:hypothetical protein